MSKVKFLITRDKPISRGSVAVNRVQILDKDSDVLYNSNIIKEVLGIIKEHGVDDVVFELKGGQQIIYTKQHYPKLLQDWLGAMIEIEDYEMSYKNKVCA
jgi:hypothetical protein